MVLAVSAAAALATLLFLAPRVALMHGRYRATTRRLAFGIEKEAPLALPRNGVRCAGGEEHLLDGGAVV